MYSRKTYGVNTNGCPRGKPEISGPLILLVISVVDQYFLQSIAVGMILEGLLNRKTIYLFHHLDQEQI